MSVPVVLGAGFLVARSLTFDGKSCIAHEKKTMV